MFTLVYINGNLNRPDTLLPFLQSNIGKTTLLQVDCVTPFNGTEQDLIKFVCEHLNSIDPQIQVEYNMMQNVSTEVLRNNNLVHFIVIQVIIRQR